jgi:hypothetical protein
MATQTKLSLGNFVEARPSPGCCVGCYATAGVPQGQEFLLGDPDLATPFNGLLARLQGTVDQGVTRRWEGKGTRRIRI